jgi:hypothetical protein
LQPGRVTNDHNIEPGHEVRIVMHMDGWGRPFLKRDTFGRHVQPEPVQFTGFKIFSRHDTREGDPVISASEMMRLWPAPLYMQYQQAQSADVARKLLREEMGWRIDCRFKWTRDRRFSPAGS